MFLVHVGGVWTSKFWLDIAPRRPILMQVGTCPAAFVRQIFFHLPSLNCGAGYLVLLKISVNETPSGGNS
jgi:hypothetical protein